MDKQLMEDPYGYFTQKCKEKGISMNELCRRANVNRSLIQGYKTNGQPRVLSTIQRLSEALEKLETEGQSCKK